MDQWFTGFTRLGQESTGRLSDPVDLEIGLIIGISNKFPGGADAGDLEAELENSRNIQELPKDSSDSKQIKKKTYHLPFEKQQPCYPFPLKKEN